MELVETAQESAGRADEQFNKYADSVEYKINTLKNSWEQLRTSFLNADIYKKGLDFANNFVSALGKMDLSQFASVGLIGVTLGKSIINNLIMQTKSMVSSFGEIGSAYKKAFVDTYNKTIGKLKPPTIGSELSEQQLIKIRNVLNELNLDSERITSSVANTTLKYSEQLEKVREINQQSITRSQQADHLWVQQQSLHAALQQQKNEYADLISRVGTLTSDELQRLYTLEEIIPKNEEQDRFLQSMYTHTQQMVNETKQLLAVEETKLETMREELTLSQRLSTLGQTLAPVGKTALQGLKSGVQSAATTALTLAISGADLSTIIQSAGTSALISAAPSILKALGQLITIVLSSTFAPVVLVITGIAATLAGIFVISKLIKANNAETYKKNVELVKALNENTKNLKENTQKNINEYNTAVSNNQKAQENAALLQALSKKTILTGSEKEQKESAENWFKENYADLIITDEITGEIQNLQEILEKIQEDTNKIKENTFIDNTKEMIQAQSALEQQKSVIEDYSVQSILYGAGGAGSNSYILDSSTEEAVQNTGRIITLTNAIAESFKMYSDSGIELDYKGLLGDIDDELKQAIITFDQTAINKYFDTVTEDEVWGEIFDTLIIAANETKDDISDIINQAQEDINKTVTSSQLQMRGWAQDTAGLYGEVFNIDNPFSSTSLFTEDQLNSFWNAKIEDFSDPLQRNFLISLGYDQVPKTINQTTDDAFDALTDELQNMVIEEIRAEYGEQLPIEDIRKKYQDLGRDGRLKMINKFFSKYAEDNLLDQNYLDKIEQIDETSWTNLTNFLSASETKNLTIEEFETQFDELIKELGLTPDEENKLRKAVNEVDNSIVKDINEAKNSLKGIFPNSFKKFGITAAQVLNDSLDALPGFQKTRLVPALDSFFSGLSDITVQALSQISFANFEDMSEDDLQLYVDIIAKNDNKTETEARAIIDAFIQLLRQNLGGAITDTQLNTIRENAWSTKQTYLNEGDGSKIGPAITEALQNEGTITSKTANELISLNKEYLVKRTEKGLELDIEKAQEEINTALMAPIEALDNSTSQLIKEHEFLEKQIALDNTTEINKALKDFKETGEWTEEWSKAFLTDTTGNLEKILTAAATKGITDIQEYYDNQTEWIQQSKDDKTVQWIDNLTNLQELYSDVFSDLTEQIEDLNEELEDLNEELEKNIKEVNEAVDDINEAQDAIEDAQEAIDEAYQSLADANEEMDKAIHGTQDFTSSLDGLINYATKLKDVENAITDITESLEDVNNADEAVGLFNSLNKSYDQKIANIGAQNRVVQDTLNNLQDTILSYYGQYVSFDETGRPQVDFSYMQMDANDEFKKDLENLVNSYEQYKDKLIENNKAIKAIEDERKKYRSQALSDYISIQEKVIDILKKQSEEEVDTIKEKYDAMSEADNDYLDALEEAINKQQQLRNKENEWDKLATQEKKLSLMQRDTSGTNAKEVAQLEQSIDESRQKLLDDSINDVINNLKELYETQKEVRDLEVEYMEEVTENAQYFNEWAKNIMSTWNSSDDMVSWFVGNNTEVEDMTVEQTEQYMQELQDDYTKFATYAALLQTDMASNTELVTDQINDLYNNVSENITNVGTITHQTAQTAADESVAAAQKSIDSAYEAIAAAEEQMNKAQEQMSLAQMAYDEAVSIMTDTQTKIKETAEKLKETENQMWTDYDSTIQQFVTGAELGIREVTKYSLDTLASLMGIDMTDENARNDFFTRLGLTQKAIDLYNGDIEDYYDPNSVTTETTYGPNQLILPDTPIQSSGFMAKEVQKLRAANGSYFIQGMRENSTTPEIVRTANGYPIAFTSYDDALNEIRKKEQDVDYSVYKYLNVTTRQFKTGGLVDYTGPAWVDGTPSRPEAFLNSEDTVRIGQAAQLLSNLPFLNPSNYNTTSVSSNVGDITYEIHLNVENISDDYSVDQMIERMRQDILDVAQPTGTPVILTK